jgi:hypothetical protein
MRNSEHFPVDHGPAADRRSIAPRLPWRPACSSARDRVTELLSPGNNRRARRAERSAACLAHHSGDIRYGMPES